jgi:CRISPR/Cas system CSM-associated protein Csm2 small subunit
MLLVDDILCAPVRSILWIFREIRDIAQKELDGEAKSITEQLRMLYMQLETGRITEAEFETGEKLLLDRLDKIESRIAAENGEPEEDDVDEEPDEDEESDEDETENTNDAGREPDEM